LNPFLYSTRSSKFWLGEVFNGNVFEGALIEKTEAPKWFRKTAEGGDWWCQWMLGLAYEHGCLADYLVSHIHFDEAAFVRKARELSRLDLKINTSEALRLRIMAAESGAGQAKSRLQRLKSLFRI
jgi:TPR repeat protein